MTKARILIVEDDGILAMHVQDMLCRLGYEVVGPVASGEEALTIVATHPIELILMDIELAGTLNGIQTAERIYQQWAVPIVFLTGYSQDPLLQQAKIAAPYGYLIKPVPERELAATVAMALNRHSLDRQLQESQAALAKSEARYRDLFENSPLGIFRTSLDGKVIAVNAEMARMVGCASPAEAIDLCTNIAEQFYADPLKRSEIIAQLHAKGALHDIQFEARKKNGDRFWLSMNARLSPAFGEDGGDTTIGIDGFAIDITERHQIEKIQTFLAQTGTGSDPEPFFPALARFLATSLDMDFVCIDRLESDCLTARTLALWSDGHFADNLSYSLKDTPCGELVGQTICCYPNAVTKLFPKDEVLQELQAESYAGVTLWGHNRQPIGLIATISRQAMVNRHLTETSLQMVADRAASELERLKTDEMIRLNEARLEGLLRINQHPTTSIQELLDFSLDEAIVLTGSKIGYIYFYEEERQEFVLNTWSKEVMAQCQVTQPLTLYHLDHTGLWGEAVRLGRPIIVNDFAAATPLKKGLPPGHAPLHRFLTIPVFSNGRIVAVVGVANKKEEYGDADTRQLTLMMDAVWGIVKRKETEEALRKSEGRLSAILDNAVSHIWAFDGTSYTYINKAYFAYTGLEPRSQLSIDSWSQRIHPADRAKAEAIWTHGWESKAEHDNVFRLRSKDGAYRTFLCHAVPIFDDTGKFSHFQGFNIDITARQNAEDALKASEEMHRALVEGLPDIIMRFDRQNRHLFVSENISDIVGLPTEKIIGKTHFELGFLESHCRLWEEAIQTVFATGQPFEGESAFKSAQGPVIHNWRIVPERSPDGGVQSVLTISRDITSHRRAERNYQTLFKEMLDGFALHEIINDEDGRPVDYRFLAINPAFERMTGLKSADTVGRRVLELMPGTEQYWIETYGRVANTGEPAFFENFSAELNKHFEVTAFRPLPGQFACIFTDITVQKLAEAEKKKLQLQLQQAQKMEAIGTLAGGIAHDFNNILSAILGYAEMAREDSLPGSLAARDLDQVIKAGNRAKDLVKQILAFSRQAETEQIHIQPATIVKETIKLLRSSLPSTITIHQDLAVDCGVIHADPTQIHQILMNLATNAYHAMEENGGILTISLRRKTLTKEDLVNASHAHPGEYVQLTVSDTGTGIEATIVDRIFDPYFTTKETGKGTGMGLAIVHGIVTTYGGLITCHSQPGEGTVFQVTLPILTEAVAESTAPLELPPLGTERILFIDDEKILANLTQTMLSRLGYSVTVRTSSIEALTTFKNQPEAFDLVITDQTMPGITGVDLARRMLQIRPGLPIILCTGYSNLISEDRVKGMGIKGFALKPLTKKDIAALIREVLDQ